MWFPAIQWTLPHAKEIHLADSRPMHGFGCKANVNYSGQENGIDWNRYQFCLFWMKLLVYFRVWCYKCLTPDESYRWRCPRSHFPPPQTDAQKTAEVYKIWQCSVSLPIPGWNNNNSSFSNVFCQVARMHIHPMSLLNWSRNLGFVQLDPLGYAFQPFVSARFGK